MDEQTTGVWIADLIRTHQEQLADQLAGATQQHLPFYAAWERAALARGIGRYFGALAEVFAAADVTPMRTYMEDVTAQRIRQGAGGMDYIWMLQQSEASVLALIAKGAAEHTATPGARTSEANRTVRAVHRSIGLVISEINLRVLREPNNSTS
jgi:hypothetical protein